MLKVEMGSLTDSSQVVSTKELAAALHCEYLAAHEFMKALEVLGAAKKVGSRAVTGKRGKPTTLYAISNGVLSFTSVEAPVVEAPEAPQETAPVTQETTVVTPEAVTAPVAETTEVVEACPELAELLATPTEATESAPSQAV